MDIKALKESTSIEEVAAVAGVRLGKLKSGRCACPFPDCQSSTAFKYTEASYKCFRCGREGDVFKFLQDLEITKNFSESLNYVKSNVSAEVEQSNNNLRERSFLMQRIFDIYRGVANDNWDVVLDYCERRGWTNTEYLRGKVGLALTGDHLTKARFTEDSIKHLELFNYGKEYYTNHIIFPVTDWFNNVIHFSGRALDPNDTLRWKSTKGSPAITKWLYNSEVIKKSKMVYLCEGMTDTMSLSQMGLPAAGMMGINSILSKHYKHLQHLESIVAFFDRDVYEEGTSKAGQYKSWSQVLPSLIDLAVLTRKDIYCVMAPSWSGVKDVNEYLMAIDYDTNTFSEYVFENRVRLEKFAVDYYKNELQFHPTLWKLLGVVTDHQDVAAELTAYARDYGLSKYLKAIHV